MHDLKRYMNTFYEFGRNKYLKYFQRISSVSRLVVKFWQRDPSGYRTFAPNKHFS
jgi:hypothetical protein